MPATARYAGELTDGALALRLQAITRLGVVSAPRHLSSIDAAATPQPHTAPPADGGVTKESRKLSVVPPVVGATHTVAAPGQPDGARASLKAANTNPTDTTPTTTPTDTASSTPLAATPSSSTPANVRSTSTPATTGAGTTLTAAASSSTPAKVRSTTTPATTGAGTTLAAAASSSTPAKVRSTTTPATTRASTPLAAAPSSSTPANVRSTTTPATTAGSTTLGAATSSSTPATAGGAAAVGRRVGGRGGDGRVQGGVGGPEGRPGAAPVLPEVRVWGARLAQAVSEVLAGDRPISQLVRFTDDVVFTELNRRVRMLGMNSTAGTRGSKEKSTVRSVRVFMPQPCIAEVAAHVRHGERSRAVAFRLEVRRNRWVCTALELG
ncbi:Rv3235 family protein [Kribbella pratensis]|uniref:Rv3235 family protein n=1 Tax=Kribbella pratensis TaxID=2512112 RepID=UPI0010670F79|nr:Rv3235 family protein [Kribbella pratensis]